MESIYNSIINDITDKLYNNIQSGKYPINDYPLNEKIFNRGYFKKISDETFNNNIDTYIEKYKNIDVISSALIKKNVILIYTNKKVGSTTLWATLEKYLGNKYSIFHMHDDTTLEKLGICDLSVLQLIEIYKYLNINVLVFDIYRPILDICLSLYCNEINIHFNRDMSKYPLKNNITIIDRFHRLLKNTYLMNNVDYFKEKYNIKEPFNNFDFENKYLYYKDGIVSYIKLRLTDVDMWPQILTKITGVNIYKIIPENVGNNKSYKDVYNYLKENYTIPKDFYEIIKNNEYFKFYLNLDEQEKYLSNISSKIINTNIMVYSDEQLALYYTLQKENEVGLLYHTNIIIENGPKKYRTNEYVTNQYSNIKQNFVKQNLANQPKITMRLYS